MTSMSSFYFLLELPHQLATLSFQPQLNLVCYDPKLSQFLFINPTICSFLTTFSTLYYHMFHYHSVFHYRHMFIFTDVPVNHLSLCYIDDDDDDDKELYLCQKTFIAAFSDLILLTSNSGFEIYRIGSSVCSPLSVI